MPTYERRFYLSLLTKDKEREQEQYEQMKNKSGSSNGKGNRTTKVSGQALKNKIKSGEIPN
jgi:hypothetical protein